MSYKRVIDATKKTKEYPVPRWLINAIEKWQKRLRLTHWTISVLLTEEPAKEAGGSALAGACINDDLYRVRLEFLPTIQDDRDGNEDITHELVHVLHIEIDRIFTEALEHIPDEKVRATFLGLYNHHLEQHVENLSLALVALMADQDLKRPK